MVTDKFGYQREKPKRYKPKQKSPDYLARKLYKNIVFSMSNPARIGNGWHVILLQAIAPRCTVHRSLLVKRAPDEEKSLKILKKWIRSLPLEALK